MLFKFAANEKIALHRHVAANNTFVIQGEHRLYYPNGDLKEVRPTGSYTVSPPSEDPHQEGGGDEDVVIHFSIRCDGGTCYEILDDDHNVASTLGFDDFEDLYAAQT